MVHLTDQGETADVAEQCVLAFRDYIDVVSSYWVLRIGDRLIFNMAIQGKLIDMVQPLLELRGMRAIKMRSRSEVIDFIQSLIPIDVGVELLRLGGGNDGGYLVPNKLEGIKACFSPGVAAQTEFEFDCLERGIEVHMADASVDNPDIQFDGVPVSFEKVFLGSSTAGDFIRLDDWIDQKSPGDADLLLQMDIEGGEYEVLHSMSNLLFDRMRIMVIEFHHLNDVWSPGGGFMIQALKRVLDSHCVVHLHPNNADPVYDWFGVQLPNSIEITFLHKSHCNHQGAPLLLPHKFDEPCLAGRSDIVLKYPWVK